MIHITQHAVQRYQERVANVTDGEARAAILSHEGALVCAARFGAPVVRCGEGFRIVMEGAIVVTVLGQGMHSGARGAI